ncbi:rhodanese-like domain-containing protein [Nonomuraea sp. NPDC050556]|uniref:rhodanese-like domain-containing protein n=1 Tax=Nonomuraea sp. NPDC050556 TaxID=3364369 RepID=UPI0037B05B56
MGVDDLLNRAREGMRRLSPLEAFEACRARDTLIVDTRPEFQRRRDGEVPGTIVVERNHLEWRLDPRSSARIPEALPGVQWIVLCDEGYSSSLAAWSLRQLGLTRATDVIGGFQSWRAAGLPVERPAWPTSPRLAPCS